MQELVLTQPTSAARAGWSGDAESKAAAAAVLRREFEERLAECGPLAFRVARGVLRNTASTSANCRELRRRGRPGRLPS